MASEKKQVDEDLPLERKFIIKILMSDVDNAVAVRLKRMGKKAKLPGFRPGKIPTKVLEQTYGAQAQSEAMNDVISTAYEKAITEKGLIPAGLPSINPVDTKSSEPSEIKDIEFNVSLEVMPDINLPDRKQIVVKKSICEVEDRDVDLTIESLRKQKTKYIEVNRDAKSGDEICIDFNGKIEGKEFQGGKAENFVYILDTGRMINEFDNVVIGMKVGESKTEKIDFPKDYPAKELAGKNVEFYIKLHRVGEPKIPELNDAFAVDFGVANGGVEKLKQDVKENLIRESANRCLIRTHNSALDLLMTATVCELPKVMVNQESQRLADSTKAELKSKGMNTEGKDLPADLFKERAERRVKLGLVVSEIIKKEKLEPSDEEIAAIVDEMSGVYEDPIAFKKWFLDDPKRKAQAEAMALERGVARWILNEAKIEEVKVPVQELLQDAAKGSESEAKE
jgi:trigger factor